MYGNCKTIRLLDYVRLGQSLCCGRRLEVGFSSALEDQVLELLLRVPIPLPSADSALDQLGLLAVITKGRLFDVYNSFTLAMMTYL